MIHDRRRFLAASGVVTLGAILVACGSKSSPTATVSESAISTQAGAFENLSGELRWTKFIPGEGAVAMTSTDPVTGEVYTIAPAAGPASLDSKASNVPVPVEDESMYAKTAVGLRATFAYFAAAVNYARTTGDTGPALQVVKADNAPQRASLEQLRVFYAPGTNWLVGGEWTFRLTEKQPVTRGTKYSWACSVTQTHGMVVEKATDTTKPLENFEAQEITALYAEYDEEEKRWMVISAQQYDPAMTPNPTYTSRPQPSSTYTPTVTDDSTTSATVSPGASESARPEADQNGAEQSPEPQDPAVQDPGAENPVVQDPAPQESAVQDPAGQDPDVENPVEQDPAPEDITA